MAGLLRATAIVEVLCHDNRGGRDKPGHDGAEKCFDMTGNPLYSVGLTAFTSGSARGHSH